MFNSSRDMIAPAEMVETLLRNRGIMGGQAVERFLNPDYARDLHDPYLYNDMERAVGRICDAIAAGEQIVVYGDYDCDGIPGSVVMHDFFAKIGYSRARVYIPHRHKEGYGLNINALAQFADEGVGLVVTVDSGITDVEEVAYAASRGIDVIVTDHHVPQAVLPPAYAVLNAKRTDNTYPDPWLCGAGVAFKLVQALVKEERFGLPLGWEKWLLDVVGIATIADMVPLTGENRALAHFGLRVLRQTRRPGLLQLLRRIRLAPMLIKEEHIGFDIGPRLNAASRLDVPMNGFRLLATDDAAEGGALASHLDALNEKRKRLVREALAQAERMVIGDEPIVVVGSPQWPVGIVGLIAGRLVERLGRPVFAWGLGEDPAEAKGSCRSDGSVNLVTLMGAATPDTFTGFGGHEGAGGFSLPMSGVSELASRLAAAHAAVAYTAPAREVEQHIDGTLDIAAVSDTLMNEIDRCGPFGEGNPRPMFVFNDVEITRAELFGKTRNHLKLFARAGLRIVPCIKFFDDVLPATGRTSFTGSLERSHFGGRTELRVRIHSFL